MGTSNRLIGYDRLLALGLLGLAIFAWLPDSFFRMMGWPWAMVWQGAFLCIITGCFWQLRQVKQPFYCLGFGLDWLVIGLFICLVISSLGASFPLLAVQNGLMVGCYIVLIYGLRNSRLSPLQLCQGAVWVGAIAATVSLILWRPTPDMWLSNNFYDAIRNRFPLGHHNFTGGYFVLVLPLAVGLAWLQSGWRKWGYGLLSAVIAVALYASGSRGAWLGGIVLILLASALGIVNSAGKTRLRVMVLSGGVFCLVLLLLSSNPRMRSLVSFSSIKEQSGTHHSVAFDGPTLDRVFMAQAAVNALKDRPLGLGPGNLGRVYDRYRPLAAGAGLNQVQQLHNTPLQIAVELGIGGGLIYVGLAMCLIRLGWQLQQLPNPKERKLSFMVIMALTGYGISSLTDYQLENIPIAVTLSLFLATLTQLGGRLSASSVLRSRWGSLLILLMGALLIQFWLRLDLALWTTHRTLASLGEGMTANPIHHGFSQAANITPWDPTPSVLAAQQLENQSQRSVAENSLQAADFYKQALHRAPNDIWFNQNLAVLAWQLGDVTTAHAHIAKVVQLSPRSKNYSYYLLGLTYQAMGNTRAAIEALALECLINPQVLTFSSWYKELEPLQKPVFNRALSHYQTILDQLEPHHALRNTLAAHIATLRWWRVDASTNSMEVAPNEESFLLRILRLIEESPDKAQSMVDLCLQDTIRADFSSCRLLKAWLQPEQALSTYLSSISLGTKQQEALRQSILTHRVLKDWLRSTSEPAPTNQRIALGLLYRNYHAQQISSILIPGNLRQFSIPVSLRLFSLAWPREFVILDNLVETVRADFLGLPHPTQNGFQLTSPSELKAS